MTKLDEEFVTAMKLKYPEAIEAIDALATEVRLLEALGARYENALLKIRDSLSAPHIAAMALNKSPRLCGAGGNSI